MCKFEELIKLNVNDKVEKKDGLSYLSWSYAWREFKKVYPDAKYEIVKFDYTDKECNVKKLPYMVDDTGLMVQTMVQADNLTYEMWLPVMDSRNKAMKLEPYTYTTKYGENTVQAATMFDVNKTIMRCLVKNLAMFGLGLYIYAGEDLPEKENIDDELISKINDFDDCIKLKEYYKENATKVIDIKKFTELVNARGKEIKGATK